MTVFLIALGLVHAATLAALSSSLGDSLLNGGVLRLIRNG